MIRRCDDRDFEVIWAIINDGAQKYKGLFLPIGGRNRICLGRSCGMK